MFIKSTVAAVSMLALSATTSMAYSDWDFMELGGKDVLMFNQNKSPDLMVGESVVGRYVGIPTRGGYRIPYNIPSGEESLSHESGWSVSRQRNVDFLHNSGLDVVKFANKDSNGKVLATFHVVDTKGTDDFLDHTSEYEIPGQVAAPLCEKPTASGVCNDSFVATVTDGVDEQNDHPEQQFESKWEMPEGFCIDNPRSSVCAGSDLVNLDDEEKRKKHVVSYVKKLKEAEPKAEPAGNASYTSVSDSVSDEDFSNAVNALSPKQKKILKKSLFGEEEEEKVTKNQIAAGQAIMSAMASIPNNIDKDKRASLGGGVGFINGRIGFAMALQGRYQDVTLKASFGVSDDADVYAVAVGAAFQF